MDKVDVKIVDVLESDDEEELDGFSLFPPIPSSSFSRSSSSSSSSSSRDEIYSGMPSSPVLQPTIIYDKMYVAPPTTRTTPTSEQEVMETLNVQEVIEDQELQKTEEKKSMVISKDVSPIVVAATPTMTGSTESFDSYVDSEPEFESDSDDDDEDDDKDDPITPHQDILDSFDVDDTSSPPPPSIRNKTNTGVFMVRKNEQGREHGDGGCDNCSACLGVEQVGVDEAIF